MHSAADHPAATSKIAVIIASLGRAANLEALLGQLSRQSLCPAQVILSVESDTDLPPADALAHQPFEVSVVKGPRGMTVQRNRGLDLLHDDIEIAIFYDDDLVPSRHALEGMAAFYAANPQLNGASGHLLADGILGPGITPAQARGMVAEADAAYPGPDMTIYRRVLSLYGCNMSYRVSAIRGLRFDENLPLYSWLEDVDFGGQLPEGTLVFTRAFYGVHCGEKRGRESSGIRLGYSQLCNPAYLARKGTMPRRDAIRQITRNFLKNHAKIFTPEPWVDRRGRAKGNWMALRDLMTGRLDPKKILDI